MTSDRHLAEENRDFVLLGDRPHEKPGDPLGFDGRVEELASLLLASRNSTPFSLGIEAAWGMGKSTLMEQLRLRLKREEQVTTAVFNAWTADGNGALEGLVKTVLNQLDDRVLRRALRNKQLMSWVRLAASMAAGLFGLGSVVDTFWDRVTGDPRARNELRTLVEQAVGAWRDQQSTIADDRTLFVFVDDLDRCSPSGVLEVFEAMKLYLDVAGLVFVVGYDNEIISDLVLQEKGYSKSITARDYLEKFIQVTYRIPRATVDEAEALLKSCLDASFTTTLFSETERALVTERNQFNPRRIKRFINSFVLAYGLDGDWRKFEAQSLVRVQLLQMYFVDFSRLLERSSDRDPTSEFLEYQAARDALRRRDVSHAAWSQIVAALESHRLPVPELSDERDDPALLQSLEEHVPVEFRPLADNPEFASLVRSLASSADWEALRAALARGTLPQLSTAHDSGGLMLDSAWLDASFENLTILWVDDEPRSVEPYADALTQRGAVVRLAADSTEAEHALQSHRFDVLVSDIARGADSEAGLSALGRFRESGLAPAHVVFFTSRITAARERWADALDAELATQPRELFAFLAQITQATYPIPTDHPLLVELRDLLLRNDIADLAYEHPPGRRIVVKTAEPPPAEVWSDVRARAAAYRIDVEWRASSGA